MMLGMTLTSVVRENARSAPDATAVACWDTVVSYSDLDLRTDRLASALVAAGVGSGDRIAWIGQNCHRWLEMLIAAGKIGAILCSLNWRQTAHELAQVVEDLRPRVVIWQRAELEQLAGGLRPVAPDALWLGHDDVSDAGYEAFLAEGAARATSDQFDDPDAPVLGLAVAGPTGDAPVSLLTHTNLLVPGLLMGKLQDIDASTVNLASAPLFHIAALFTLIPTLQFRGTNVMVSRADPEKLCKAIERHRCTHGFLLTPTAEEIVKVNADGRYDLRSFHSGLPDPQWRTMVAEDTSSWGRRTGGYGQTETGMAVLAALGVGHSATAGRVAPYAEVRVADDDDIETPVDEIGEIVVRGAGVHLGYWNRDDLNKQRFRDGWWHTGDLGRRESDGTVVFVSPMGRMLKSGAENIYAGEVERCIAEHPAVREAAVLGIPDDVWVQTMKAVVVVESGASTSEEELIAYCRERLAPYKKPRSVVIQYDPLPRADGGIDYPALDELHGGGNYPGHGTRSV